MSDQMYLWEKVRAVRSWNSVGWIIYRSTGKQEKLATVARIDEATDFGELTEITYRGKIITLAVARILDIERPYEAMYWRAKPRSSRATKCQAKTRSALRPSQASEAKPQGTSSTRSRPARTPAAAKPAEKPS